MGDMGLAGAYGAEGAAEALRQLIKDRLAQQQQTFENNRLTANDKMNADLHAEQMRSLQENRASTQQAALEGEAAKGVSGLSVNQSIPAPMMGRLRGTMQAANIAENPPLAQPPNMPDMMQPDIVPGMQPGAVWKGTDAQRTADEDKQKMAELMNDPNTTPQVKSFIRMRGIMPKGENIPYQLITEPNGPPKAARQPVQVGPQGIFTDPEDAIGKPGYHAPQQPIVVQTGTGPQLLDRGTGTASPIKDASGATVGPKESAQSERQTKAAGFALGDAQAVSDQINAAEQAGLLGPSSGRVQGQFLAGIVGSTGNPDTDRKLGGLKAAIDNLKTSYPMAISGTARGGGGGVDRLMNVLNSDKLSADLMHGAVDEIHGALTRRTGSKPSETPSGGGGNTQPDGGDEWIDLGGGVKVRKKSGSS